MYHIKVEGRTLELLFNNELKAIIDCHDGEHAESFARSLGDLLDIHTALTPHWGAEIEYK